MIIHLSPSKQAKPSRVQHPLLDGAISYTVDELEPIVARRLSGGGADELIIALRSCIRYLVGRYVSDWPVTRPMVDDMVSEGFVAVVRLVRDLKAEDLEEKHILKLASSKIRGRIERYVNVARGIALPSKSQQERCLAEGVELGGLSVDDPTEPIDNSLNQAEVDIRDTLEALNLQCELSRALMDPSSWTMSNKQLASKFNVSEGTVTRVKQGLDKQYRELERG